MELELDFFEGIHKLFSYYNLVSISGESGTGKTTLALNIIGNLLTYKAPFKDSCIWIQTGESFPHKRLAHMFAESKEKLEYIENNIYVIPQQVIVHTYEEQTTIFQKFGSNADLPPDLKYVVIDNISHHLRYKLTHYNTFKDISSLLDCFYETQLMPLILFCKRHEIVLILIHEVTYSPKLQRVRPFLYKLYDRINTIDITLSNIVNDEKKSMQILVNEIEWNFKYTLEHRGFVFK
ncbi:MAG: AAA family ATPase [Promethearchaeota archaeon]